MSDKNKKNESEASEAAESTLGNNHLNGDDFRRELDDQCGDYDDSDDDELMKRFKRELHKKQDDTDD